MDRPGLGAPVHWLSVQAQALVENQHVVQIDSETTIDDACDTLIKHNVQSVPLYDSASRSYVGMFDLHDLATYILMKRRSCYRIDEADVSSGGGGSPKAAVVADQASGSPLARKATLARRDSLGRAEGGGRGRSNSSSSRIDQVSKVTDLSHMNPFYSVVPETT
ncbi:cell separation during budding, partial [Coemansia erecta]